MAMNSAVTKVVLAGVLTATSASFCPAADQDWYVQPSFGATYPDQKAYSGQDLGLRLNLGRNLSPRWFSDLGLASGKFKPEDHPGLVDEKSLELSIGYKLTPAYAFQPYAVAGAGTVRRSYQDSDDYAAATSFGVGYLLGFRSLPSLKVVNEFRGRYSFANYRDAETAKPLDALGLIGIRYAFGNQRAAQLAVVPAPAPLPSRESSAPPVASLPVAAPVKIASAATPPATSVRAVAGRRPVTDLPDRDRDGIADIDDQCPNTIAGVTTDIDGCMVSAR